MSYFNRLAPFLSPFNIVNQRPLLTADEVIRFVAISGSVALESDGSGNYQSKLEFNAWTMGPVASVDRKIDVGFTITEETLNELISRGMKFSVVVLSLPQYAAEKIRVSKYEELLTPDRWDYTLVKLRSMPSLEKGFNLTFLELCGFRLQAEEKVFTCVAHTWYLPVLSYLLKCYFGNNYSANIGSIQYAPYSGETFPVEKLFRNLDPVHYLAEDFSETSDIFDGEFQHQANDRLAKNGIRIFVEDNERLLNQEDDSEVEEAGDEDPFTEDEWYNINNSREK